MKTRIYLLMLAFFMFAGFSANAQSRYSAEVDIGYTMAVGDIDFVGDRVNISTTHGVNINERFFIGAGAMYDYYYDIEASMLPVYANLKAFANISQKSAGFISCDIGYSISLDGGNGGFYCCPGAGIKLGSFKIQAGYSMLKASSNNSSTTLGAVQFKVGFMF